MWKNSRNSYLSISERRGEQLHGYSFFLGKKKRITGNKEMQPVSQLGLISWLYHPRPDTLILLSLSISRYKMRQLAVRTMVIGFSTTDNRFYYFSSAEIVFGEVLFRRSHLHCSNSFVSRFIVFPFQSYSSFKQQ